MGVGKELRGHVDSVARGIRVPNAQPDQAGLASVNPVFTWVRLAQRVPVRIALDDVPADVRLVAGMTATLRVDRPAEGRTGAEGQRGPDEPRTPARARSGGLSGESVTSTSAPLPDPAAAPIGDVGRRG